MLPSRICANKLIPGTWYHRAYAVVALKCLLMIPGILTVVTHSYVSYASLFDFRVYDGFTGDQLVWIVLFIFFFFGGGLDRFGSRAF